MHSSCPQKFVLSVTLALFIAGCIAARASSAAISEVDFRGRTVTLAQPAKRVVCLIESALSGLYMLGAGQQVVGVSANIYSTGVYSWYAALDERIRTKKLPAPGNWDFVNLESVIVLRPDLVVIWAEQTETITALEERGIPVFGILLRNKEDVYREVEALGKLTGKEKRAEELVNYAKNELAKYAKRLPSELHRTKVYYMWAQGNLETSCRGSTVNDLIELAGGRNVCAESPSEHMVVNLERILAWNPELIVMWYNERKTPQDIINDPQWRTISAVQTGRVYAFPEVFLCDLWTLKFQFAVKMVAKWSHPELFRDIDLEKEKSAMLNQLYGRNFQEN